MRTLLRLAVLGVLVSNTQFATCRADENLARPGWKLTFDDEFNGNGLDTSKWTPKDPWGRERNRELQAYVTDAFEVKDSILRIKTERRQALYDGKQREYISGMMTTYGKFSQEYGRFEIRCRIPNGKGMWPAFWLLPDPLDWPPEIDVLEILGHQPNKVYMTHHFQAQPGKHGSHGGSWVGPDFSSDFHQFAIEWSPRAIVWFVDGVERFRSKKPIPRGKMYLLVNLAIGGDWPGAPDENTRFPAALEVDYVRVYESDMSTQPNENSEDNDLAATLNTVKTAVVDYFAKYGSFPQKDETFELTLVKEGLLKQAPSWHVRVLKALSSAENVTATNAAYNFHDGPVNQTVGSVIIEAAIPRMTSEDARTLSLQFDGEDLSSPVGEADLKGRVKFGAIPTNGVGEVHVYLTHR
jgi:beta-glucanase (GH16 family)